MKSWLKTLVAYAIPLLIITVSIGIMTMEPGRSKRIGGDQFSQQLDQLQQEVQEENWQQSRAEINKLQQVFQQRVKRLQFSSERDELRLLNLTLVQIEAYIVCQDRTEAIASIFAAREHWANLDH